MTLRWLCVVVAVATGCSSAEETTAPAEEVGADEDATADASSTDGASDDASSGDATLDSTTADASAQDTATSDAAASDARDAAVRDAAQPDARRDGAADARPDAASDAGPLASAGCGKTVVTGASSKTITVGTLARTYILSVPAGYVPTKAYPLAFAWHARTGSGSGFRSGGDSYGGSVEQAAAGKAIFVYPDGLPVTSDPGDTGWADTSETSRDFAFFDALLADVSAKMCVDRSRVFSYGHSFGGFMTNALGCHRSSALRGLAPVAAGPSGSWKACDAVPVPIWIHNTQDDGTVKYTPTGLAGRDWWVNNNGCGTTTTAVGPGACVAYAGCDVPTHWCAPATGGHGWPAIAGAGIWSFFESL